MPGHHGGARSQYGSLKSFFFVDFGIYIYIQICVDISQTCIDMYIFAYIAKPVHRLYYIQYTYIYYSISTYNSVFCIYTQKSIEMT